MDAKTANVVMVTVEYAIDDEGVRRVRETIEHVATVPLTTELQAALDAAPDGAA